MIRPQGHQLSTQLQLSSCLLPSAAKARAREQGSEKHSKTFPGDQATISLAQNIFQRGVSLTDDVFRSEVLSTRRRLAVAVNILNNARTKKSLVG